MLEKTETDADEREHKVETEEMTICQFDTPASESNADEMRYARLRSVVRRRVEEGNVDFDVE